MNKNNYNIIRKHLNNNEIGNLSINQLSKKMNVSASALTRYAQKEGFNGFKELKYFYNRNMETSSRKELNTLLKNTIFSIKRTIDFIKKNKIEWLAKKINEKDNVVIFGESFTFINAKYMERSLRKININASVRNVASELAVINSQKDTIFIFLSNSGMNKRIKKAASKLYSNKKQGQVIVSITTNNYSNIENMSNEWISGYFFQENVNNQYELPSICNTIMNLIINLVFEEIYKINKITNDELIKSQAIDKEK